MKRLLTACTLLLVLGTALADETTVTLRVDKMTCALCPAIVKKAISRVEGVTTVKVSFAAKTAAVSFDDSVTSWEAVAEASTNAGYPATMFVDE